MDLGANIGDWVMNLAAFSDKLHFLTVEANSKAYTLFQANMLLNSMTTLSAGEEKRVHAHHAAASSYEPFGFVFSMEKLKWTQASISLFNTSEKGKEWHGPTLCSHFDGEISVESGGKPKPREEMACKKEHIVPQIPVDLLFSAQQHENTTGKLLALKIDIERMEFSALLGAFRLLTDPATKPCYIYIEMRPHDDIQYTHAFHLLRDVYGYEVYDGLNSGSRQKFPPQTAEENYVFRQNNSFHSKCLARVHRSSCALTKSIRSNTFHDSSLIVGPPPSERRQSDWLASFFHHKTNGVFVEAGGYDGRIRWNSSKRINCLPRAKVP